MHKPKLVLSNTTTFFSGKIERVFKKAKQHGFQYLEIIPYRWTDPDQVLALEQKYQIQTVGIHMPEQWNLSLWEEIKQRKRLIETPLPIIFNLYLGRGINSPALSLAETLQQHGRQPYLLFHADLLKEIGSEMTRFIERYNVVIENIPYQKGMPKIFWDPIALEQKTKRLIRKQALVFDPGHFEDSIKDLPELKIDIVETYKQIQPRVMHIAYNDYSPFFHTLPTEPSRKTLLLMLKHYMPEYIVLETNFYVRIKTAKAMIERIINQASL